MLHRIPMRSRLAAALAAAFVGVAALAWAAPADDFREAQKLYGQGKVQPALEKVDGFLRAQPKDPQGRFLRGILLTELKRTPEAIQAFTSLTEDFPELPEPYNNLAVLYASQGNYDKAKSALELAIHTHPSYATAHENLGDIYAQLASRAYDRALQLDKNNPTAQSKLAMIKELFSSSKAGGQRPEASRAAAVARSEPTRVEPAKVEPAKVEPPKVAEAPKAAAKAAAEGNPVDHPPTRSCLMSHRSPDFTSLSVLVLVLLSVSERYAWRMIAVASLPETSTDCTFTSTSIDLGASMRSVRCFSHAARDILPGGSKSGA